MTCTLHNLTITVTAIIPLRYKLLDYKILTTAVISVE